MNQQAPFRTLSLLELARHVNTLQYNDEIVGVRVRTSRVSSPTPIRVEAFMVCLYRNVPESISFNMREYRVSRNALIVMHPNSFVTRTGSAPDGQVMVLVISREIMEEIIPKVTDLLPVLINTHGSPIFGLSDEEADLLQEGFEMVFRHLPDPDTPFKRSKILCMVQALLYEIMEMRIRNTPAPPPRKSRSEEIMAKFLVAVNENFRTFRKVSQYAELLCITPKHLSSVVKEVSGRTADQWIDTYVVMEAKVLLHSTDLTIQEIATRLNFPNQSFFGKYFKHHTGYTPTAYRLKHS